MKQAQTQVAQVVQTKSKRENIETNNCSKYFKHILVQNQSFADFLHPDSVPHYSTQFSHCSRTILISSFSALFALSLLSFFSHSFIHLIHFFFSPSCANQNPTIHSYFSPICIFHSFFLSFFFFVCISFPVFSVCLFLTRKIILFNNPIQHKIDRNKINNSYLRLTQNRRTESSSGVDKLGTNREGDEEMKCILISASKYKIAEQTTA